MPAAFLDDVETGVSPHIVMQLAQGIPSVHKPSNDRGSRELMVIIHENGQKLQCLGLKNGLSDEYFQPRRGIFMIERPVTIIERKTVKVTAPCFPPFLASCRSNHNIPGRAEKRQYVTDHFNGKVVHSSAIKQINGINKY